MTDIIDLALACYRRPLDYQDRLSLAAPLPEGMDRLLWLANGSPEILDAATHQTGANPQALRDAARFCIQQWCLVRGADPHRVLGVAPGAAPEQIKEHYRLLMRLFHPDRVVGRETWTDHYASQINAAWTALSRAPDSAVSNHQASPRSVPDQHSADPLPNRAVKRPGPLSSRYPLEQRRRPRRRWLPRLALGGLMLVVMMVLGGFYLDHFSVSRGGLEPASAGGSAPPFGATRAPELVAPPADSGAFGPFMAAPDWQALEQREQHAQRQVVQAQEARQQWEEDRRQQRVAEEALLESMREERAQLEEQIEIEQARMKQARAAQMADEQQRLARLQAEQARFEQARVERELTERRRLEALQAEQAKAEQLAEKLRVERQRLEKLKAEQTRVGQVKSEQAKLEQEQMQAERRRLEEQLKAEKARADQAKNEQAKLEQVQAERRRLEEQLKAEKARAEQAKNEQAKLEQVQAERRRLEEQLKAEKARAEQARLEVARRAPTAPMTVVVVAPEKDALTAAEVESLMSRYTRAYQQGDLNGVMALLATGPRNQIRGDYATLFANHYVRGLWLRDLHWAYRGQSARGSGHYELKLLRRDNGELRQVRGSIRFTVQKQDDQVLIEAIEYDWPQS